MRLTKQQTKLHDEAAALAKCGPKLHEEREFVWANYHPAAGHNTTKTGAFFTPLDIAWEAACQHGGGGKVIDFCAGIGALAGMLLRLAPDTEITCIETNPDYVAVGKALVPDARWLEADALAHLETYDSAISNPPFGRIGGVTFEDEAMRWLAAHTTRGAILILPRGKHQPVKYSPPNGWSLTECPVDLSGVESFKTTNIRVSLYDLSPEDK